MSVLKIVLAIIMLATFLNTFASVVVPGVYTWLQGEIIVLCFICGIALCSAMIIWALSPA